MYLSFLGSLVFSFYAVLEVYLFCPWFLLVLLTMSRELVPPIVLAVMLARPESVLQFQNAPPQILPVAVDMEIVRQFFNKFDFFLGTSGDTVYRKNKLNINGLPFSFFSKRRVLVTAAT